MSASTFIQLQVTQIKQGGRIVLFTKIKRALKIPLRLLLLILAIPPVLFIRILRPWLLVRVGGLRSDRIGHFAGNTELYFCERDAGINVPKQRHVDLFYMGLPICNQQLATMWKRVLRVWPAWILAPITQINRLIPGGAIHEIGNNTQNDRDVHNLLDRFPPHLQFTPEEETRGEDGLQAMGISQDTPFVCLLVRDSAYLNIQNPGGVFNYHNYRDSDVQNYVLAANELADRGYFVIRMGVKVPSAIKSAHPKVIDYAANGMRNDFMDIYLGAKCAFCISTGAGWDAVPTCLFRKPWVLTNLVPLGYASSYSKKFLLTTKRHVNSQMDRELTLIEIFTHDVGFCSRSSDYKSKGIQLIENTPEEIRDVVIEMAERLNATWRPYEYDEVLQKRFWEIFPADAVSAYNGRPLHGEIRARFGAAFLRNNKDWLQ